MEVKNMSKTAGSPLRKEFFQFLGHEIRDERIDEVNTYLRWKNDLQELYVGIFEWELPDLTIDVKKVEQWLLFRGSVAFFIDEYMGPLILPYVTQGSLNQYGNPTTIRAYGLNGYQIILQPGQYVLIYDNRMQTVNAPALDQYAVRLSQLDRTIDINVNAQRTPVLLTAENEGQMTTLKSAYRKLATGEPVIAQIGNTVGAGVSALKTDAPPVFAELQAYKEMLLAEVLTFIGVPNRGKEKKAQVVSSEISAINGHVFEERNRRLSTRKAACEQINQLFGQYGIHTDVDYAAKEYNYAMMETQVATPEGK
jgi:hypothetical protein